MNKIIKILNKDIGTFSSSVIILLWSIYILILSSFLTSFFLLMTCVLILKLKLGLIVFISIIFIMFRVLVALVSIVPNLSLLFKKRKEVFILKQSNGGEKEELNGKSIEKYKKLKQFILEINKQNANFDNLEFFYLTTNKIDAWVLEDIKKNEIYSTAGMINTLSLNKLKFIYLHEYRHLVQNKDLKLNLLKILFWFIPFWTKIFTQLKEKDADLFAGKNKSIANSGVSFFNTLYKLEKIYLKNITFLIN